MFCSAGEAKSLKKPPPGVDDITAVVIILLEGNPKDKSWGAACKVRLQCLCLMLCSATFSNSQLYCGEY